MTDAPAAASSWTAFAREAVRGAFLSNSASLIALPLAAMALGANGPVPRLSLALAGGAFAVGVAAAGLLALVGTLYLRPRAEGAAGGGVLLALGMAAGTIAYLAFLSGWIFLGHGVLVATPD